VLQLNLRFIFLFVLLSIVALSSMAQNQAITESQLFYKKRILFGGNLNSGRFGGINFKYGWQKTGTKKNMLDFELLRIKHPKEARIYGQSDNPQKYTFGLLNMLFLVRTGYGQTIFITERPYKNAVQLNFNYNVGLSTALLKPIYLDIAHSYPDKNGSYINSERYNPEVHTDQNDIWGTSSFFKGIGNTSAQLGAYGRASLSIEWGEYPETFNCVEAGFAVDAFPQGLPIMAFSPENYYLFTFFIGYQFGWNK
jgi:hypothetical protein